MRKGGGHSAQGTCLSCNQYYLSAFVALVSFVTVAKQHRREIRFFLFSFFFVDSLPSDLEAGIKQRHVVRFRIEAY
jgi:hypothetical protein